MARHCRRGRVGNALGPQNAVQVLGVHASDVDAGARWQVGAERRPGGTQSLLQIRSTILFNCRSIDSQVFPRTRLWKWLRSCRKPGCSLLRLLRGNDDVSIKLNT